MLFERKNLSSDFVRVPADHPPGQQRRQHQHQRRGRGNLFVSDLRPLDDNRFLTCFAKTPAARSLIMWNYELRNRRGRAAASHDRRALDARRGRGVAVDPLRRLYLTCRRPARRGWGSATRSGDSAGNRGIAQGLADDLMAEILVTAYNDPNGIADVRPGSGGSGAASQFRRRRRLQRLEPETAQGRRRHDDPRSDRLPAASDGRAGRALQSIPSDGRHRRRGSSEFTSRSNTTTSCWRTSSPS